jgi:hypothetical protein
MSFIGNSTLKKIAAIQAAVFFLAFVLRFFSPCHCSEPICTGDSLPSSCLIINAANDVSPDSNDGHSSWPLDCPCACHSVADLLKPVSLTDVAPFIKPVLLHEGISDQGFVSGPYRPPRIA